VEQNNLIIFSLLPGDGKVMHSFKMKQGEGRKWEMIARSGFSPLFDRKG
jgi:hypothetical protein